MQFRVYGLLSKGSLKGFLIGIYRDWGLGSTFRTIRLSLASHIGALLMNRVLGCIVLYLE